MIKRLSITVSNLTYRTERVAYSNPQNTLIVLFKPCLNKHDQTPKSEPLRRETKSWGLTLSMKLVTTKESTYHDTLRGTCPLHGIMVGQLVLLVQVLRTGKGLRCSE